MHPGGRMYTHHCKMLLVYMGCSSNINVSYNTWVAQLLVVVTVYNIMDVL